MNARRHLIRSTAAAGAVALGALSLSACGGDAAAQDDTVQVVASFYPMDYLAQRIGGDHVTVTDLTHPGVEPHDLELSPKQTVQLGKADLVVYLKGLQPAVDKAVAQSGVEHVAEATSYTTLEDHGTNVDGSDHDHAHAAHGHDAAADPHIWLDPVRYAKVAQGVGKELAAADPDHKADYRKNTEKLVDDLHALDEEFTKGLHNRETDTFVTTHAAFGYLAERYGLHEVAVSGIDPESGSVSGAHLKKLHKVIKREDVGTVFFETGASGKIAQTMAVDLGVQTAVLSPLETVKDPERQDYFSVMHQNLAALRSALDAK
ncbi:MAG TPA: metal ABC transporter substrate-binding protein [Streptomyces sp.]|nr:metal ABC transporter substrate-binding protein [Streptomyces sp.]